MDNDQTSRTNTPEETPHMKSLALCLNRMVLDGYDHDFKVSDTGLNSLKTNRVYNADEVKVVNFFRFEGQSDPEDNTILYVIETSDGTKGTLVDAYGPYADAKVAAFIKEVDSIHKKSNQEDQ